MPMYPGGSGWGSGSAKDSVGEGEDVESAVGWYECLEGYQRCIYNGDVHIEITIQCCIITIERSHSTYHWRQTRRRRGWAAASR